MKKLVAMFLMFVLLLLSVSCSAQTEEKTIESIAEQTRSTEEEDPLVVCVSSRAFLQNTAIQSKVYNYVKPECDRIVFECLPDDDADREAYCQRIRIELMSGGGPDVFILESDLVSYNGLFSDVEKIMHGGHFLPLDSYIESWDTNLLEKQSKVIMDAGKTEEGQVVLPLTYRLPVYVVYENAMIDNEAPFKTWEALRIAAEEDETVAMVLSERKSHWLAERFGQVGDYAEEEITLTEEEIRTVLEQVQGVEEKESVWDEVYAGAAPDQVIEMSGEEGDNLDLLTGMHFGSGIYELAKHEDRSALAVYNTEGGLTAQITSFAAVNRNTKHPEDAAKIASVLYNTEFQTLISEEGPATVLTMNLDFMGLPTSSDYNYASLLEPYLNEVNAVRFGSEFDRMFSLLSVEAKDQDAETLAKDTLQKMKMIMAE